MTSHRPAPSRPANQPTKKVGKPPAMKRGRADRTSSMEHDQRGPDDRDGNEGHARSHDIKPKGASSPR
jgi:hypothetical protein